jgi:fatty acid desaturase
MQNPTEFYNNQLSDLTLESSKIKKKLYVSSVLRFFTFSSIILGIYLFFGNFSAIAIVVILGISLFVFLILKHTDLQYKYDLNKALITINKTELKV